ncbi:MAG: hypothetical protein VXW87_04880 [Pseudomonadota bacterium]|nr:hypothetical protein [Pseudomonadota bacterium]
MRAYIRAFALILLSTASSVYAGSVLEQISEYDESLLLIRSMYGSVNGLTGGVDGLTALMFKIFNISALVFASIFFSITVSQNVISSASQGVMMGKKQSQSAYFTIFRSMSGMLAIFPQYNGYSLIQVFIMTVVLKSMSLAGDVSNLIITEVMKTPLNEIVQTTLGIGSSKQALDASKLLNPDVQSFYNTVYGMARDSVIYNRQAENGFRVDSATKLYEIKKAGRSGSESVGGYQIQFKGSDKKIGLNSPLPSFDPFFHASLRQIINPIVRKLYDCLPDTQPADAIARTCGSVEKNEGPCKGLTEEDIKNQIKTSIEVSHDRFAEYFVLPTLREQEPEPTPIKGYKNNWLHFPFLLQSAIKLGTTGTEVKSLDDLFGQTFGINDGVFTSEIPKGTANKFTSLGTDGNNSAAILNISSTSGEKHFEDLKSAYEVKVETYSQDGDGSAKNTAMNTVVNAMNKIKESATGQLDPKRKIMRKPDSNNQGFSQLQSQFHENFSLEEASGGSFNAERVAMKKPIIGLLSTGEQSITGKWIETYIGLGEELPAIRKEPIGALTDLSQKMAKDTLYFMFTLMRNVLVEQIHSAARTFWDFFFIKLGFIAGEHAFRYVQESGWDGVDCQILSIVPGVGSSPRRPFCNPLFWVPPIAPNPGWAGEFPGNLTAVIVGTIGNTVTSLTDDIISGLYTYDFIIKTQFAYAYYGYILAAVTPIMIVSNLLALWIPMLPMLVYYIAIIGWCFAVLEAMVASPLVLMGMTFPQGHDFLGTAQQALILILGVFVRAPLIVVGFFIGMLMLIISMLVLSFSIVPLVLSLFGSLKTNLTLGDGICVAMFMVVTLYLTLSILNQALSVTYKLPNIILSWIGGQRMDGFEGAAIQQIVSVVTGQGQGALSAIQQAGMASKGDQVAGQAVGGFSQGGRSLG